jgi:ribosome-associated protein
VTGALDLVAGAAGAAAEKQAHDIVVLDVREVFVLTDYFLIASGSNERQVRTIAEEIQRAAKERGLRPVRREGEREGRWILLDFVDFVAHVFLDEDRQFYELERLWADAPRVDWERPAASTGG